MRIQFCGADRTVTGSCHLIEVNGLRIFLDMGMYQGPRAQARIREGAVVRRAVPSGAQAGRGLAAQRLALVNHLFLFRQDSAEVIANPAPQPHANTHTSTEPLSHACS